MPHRQVVSSIFVCGVLLAPASAAQGQQTCLTPTPTARGAITSFLQTPTESTWLQAHSITATSAEQLAALTDAVDAMLCRKMDSTLAISPAYYLRSGSYVIASVAQPKSVIPGRISGRDLGRDIFVFDSTGRWIHSPGESVPIAPPDLRLATALAGAAELRWTNRDPSVTSILVQRASGAGSYVTLGTVTGSTTSYLDATAVAGAVYRYQLVAVNAEGGMDVSNEVPVTIGDLGSLTRTTTGLLFRDDFNRADGELGADWTAESGSWTISNGELRAVTTQGANTVLRLNGFANRRDFHVQVKNARSNLVNYGTMWVRRSSGFYQVDLGASSDAGRANVPRVYRNNGWWGLLAYGVTSAVTDTAYRVSYSLADKEHRLWVNGIRQLVAQESASTDLGAGGFAFNTYGNVSGGVVRFDNLVICSDRIVTITGLPAGYRLRIAGLLSELATAGVSVTLDLMGTELPLPQIEVLDSTGAVVKVFAPADGVWGGDRYSLNGL